MIICLHIACFLTLLTIGALGCEPVSNGDKIADGGQEVTEGGNEAVEGGNEAVEGGNEAVEGGNEAVEGGNEAVDGGNEVIEGGNEYVESGLYAEWFVDYNQGQDITYLDDNGTIYEEGDTNRYPMAPSHTFIENAAYGPFSRNVIDIYLPNNVSEPTPIVVYVHGGGFSSGDKTKIHKDKADIPAYLASGIAVASISYRYGAAHLAAAQTAIIPNGICDGSDGGCRKDYVFRDGARAIQYIRYRAQDLNIDSSKIAAWGSSAGGQIVMWIATKPNLAVQDHPDPVLREDSRVQVAGHMTSQVSALNSDWPTLLSFSDSFWDAIGWSNEIYDKMLQDSISDLKTSPEGQILLQVIDYYGAISASSPPIMAACSVFNHSEEMLLDPSNADDLQSQVVHHPFHSLAIYEKCLAVQEECEIATKMRKVGKYVEQSKDHTANMQAFLTGRLKEL